MRLFNIRERYPQIINVSHRGILNSLGGHLETERPDADLKFILSIVLFII